MPQIITIGNSNTDTIIIVDLHLIMYCNIKLVSRYFDSAYTLPGSL